MCTFETCDIGITELIQKTSSIYCYEHAKPLHKAVVAALQKSTPDNMLKMAIENPTLSADGESVAYYQSPDKIGKIRATTKPGKYLRRHFSGFSDTDVRDIIACTCTKFEILSDMDEIVHAVRNGPYSCMKDHKVSTHPYRVYSARFGWSLAVRKNAEDKVIGRALLNNKCFVRSFTDSTSGEGYARGADSQLEALLTEAGCKKISGWQGFKLERIELSSERFIMPYLDGEHRGVDDCRDHFVICKNGDFTANETQGYIEIEDEDMYSCEHCGARVHMDDLCNTIDGSSICGSCANDMIYVESRRYTRYENGNVQNRYTQDGYANSSDVVEVDGKYYLKDDIDKFDIVECEDGEYRKIDNVVFDVDSEEYYSCESDEVKYCEDDNEYHSEYWQCSVTEDYYSNNEDSVTLEDGEIAHPDNAWKCSVTGAYYSNDDDHYQVILKNGDVAHEDNAWECEVSGEYYPNNEPYIVLEYGKAHATSLIAYSA